MDVVNPHDLLAQAQRLVTSGQIAAAEGILRQLLQSYPSNAELLHHIGLLCYQQRKLDEAERLVRAAIALEGSSAAFHSNLGEVLRAKGRVAEAIEQQRRAIALQPGYARAHYNLGVALRQMNRLDEAIETYRRATQLSPDDVRAWNNLGTTLRAQGRVTEAVSYFRKCLELSPSSDVHSNLLYAMWFDPDKSPSEIAVEHERWAQRWALPLAREIRPHDNARDPDRRLRIGYVSPDFCGHVIAVFMQPILHHRDRAALDVVCYADVPEPDFMTGRLRADADSWVSTTGMSDAALAERIRADHIDILVDLTAHMARNRMLTFARKPAPVQVSYLAYAGTTGLPVMDYRLSDPHLDPDGVQTWGPEKVVRLPQTYWCYQPQIDVPQIGPLPSRSSGHVRFVCYNHCAKINRHVIALWSRILKQVRNSCIRLAVGGGENGNAHLEQAFGQLGVAPSRIELRDLVPYESYFKWYADADIALDPFPYNGGTTTLDSLHMGVPVVTLAGTSGMSRAGVSILTNAGLPELIAATPQDYVRIAIELARDLPRLALLRQSLRDRLRRSPLMDARGFVRGLEDTYRALWGRYCRGNRK